MDERFPSLKRFGGGSGAEPGGFEAGDVGSSSYRPGHELVIYAALPFRMVDITFAVRWRSSRLGSEGGCGAWRRGRRSVVE